MIASGIDLGGEERGAKEWEERRAEQSTRSAGAGTTTSAWRGRGAFHDRCCLVIPLGSTCVSVEQVVSSYLVN